MLRKILDDLASRAGSKAEKGRLFERLVRRLLETAPIYRERYERVWLWGDFPHRRPGRTDTGIDLVAKLRGTDEYAAIQCKFYDRAQVSKADVDTFLAASGQPFTVDGKEKRFSERVLVSTTDSWSSKAEDIIEGQIPPVTRIRMRDLEESGVDWSAFSLEDPDAMRREERKELREHQKEALEDVLTGFKEHDRGKLIMACGTGKTLTSLRIAEEIAKIDALAGGGGASKQEPGADVLFLVPSISLLNQSLLEWTAQCRMDFAAFAVCSDSKAGSRAGSDRVVESASDTVIPATTDVERLVAAYEDAKDRPLRLFFSTYQSIGVISRFQEATHVEFNLVVCDEAHRTTGVKIAGEDESAFVRVHDNKVIPARRRMYMTATPRIYGDAAKMKADMREAVLCSMDDEELYGPEFHRLGFGKAVEQELLSDYKVLILAVDEEYASRTLQAMMSTSDQELMLDDAVKIIGCLNGLSKRTVFDEDRAAFAADPLPMRRAVAFNSTIRGSKLFRDRCEALQAYFQDQHPDSGIVPVEVRHVDGQQNALQRGEELDWLRGEDEGGTCRVLTNARCLSEGVDVRSLDAVMFLNPRNSPVDIVQAVGRVMRRAEGKKYGYIILPVGIPAGVRPEDALRQNKKYEIVWSVLQALRAHDDRFSCTVSQIELNKRKPPQLSVIGVKDRDPGDGQEKPDEEGWGGAQLSWEIAGYGEWKDAIYARIVEKCGERRYWESWAGDVADIAQRIERSITAALGDPHVKDLFERFLQSMRRDLNPMVTKSDAVEMLAQHAITKPVFDALFVDYKFSRANPVSRAMEDLMAALGASVEDLGLSRMEPFFESIRQRVRGVDNAAGRQKVVTELYETFFRIALPRQAERLGIVYTPIEVVDFILQSVVWVLRERFGRTLDDPGVSVLDPFTGTGTFIVRLLQGGLISDEALADKYRRGIFANEIVLLAYYIAAVNIEEAYHERAGTDEYVPFPGIVLTDTFGLVEAGNPANGIQSEIVASENTERARREMQAPITVIVGNPPYSVGQKSANDNNANRKYEVLDRRIEQTYVAESSSTSVRTAYDSYVRAFRWASDRIGDDGIVGFVTNGSFVDGLALDGVRRCLLEEFSSVYIFNLRGNARTSGEQRRREKDNIFGVGSRAPVAITIAVRHAGDPKDGFVRYCDIGDYRTREQKLATIFEYGSVADMPWHEIVPNEHADWLLQRSEWPRAAIPIRTAKESGPSLYGKAVYRGITTNRDPWVYGFSATRVLENANRMIGTYNAEREKGDLKEFEQEQASDPQQIKWTRSLLSKLKQNVEIRPVAPAQLRVAMYRPFCKKHLVYDRDILECPSQLNQVFPNADSSNRALGYSCAPLKHPFGTLMTEAMQDMDVLCHTRSVPEAICPTAENKAPKGSFFESAEMPDESAPRQTLTPDALAAFHDRYGSGVTAEDVFYYVYAVFHSPGYRERYQDNLAKEDPRIPMLDGFSEYVRIGRELADLHVNYERPADPKEIPGLEVEVRGEDYTVQKMRFAKQGKAVRKDTILFNPSITVRGIPERAYAYVLGSRSAIEWIMECYQVKVDKDSGIRDDPNDYSDDPSYILNLLVSVIHVSLRTLDLMEELPEYRELE